MTADPGWPDGPVLALDTATPLGSIAIGTSGHVRAEVTLGLEVRHSETLLPAVSFALTHCRLSASDLTGIVVGGGPGSFTGVRIAAATAKALVHALGIPLWAYSSLASLAVGAGIRGRPVCALFDGRRGEVYAACYRFEDGEVTTLLAPTALRVEAVVERLRDVEPVFVGDGAWAHADLIGRSGGQLGGQVLSVPRAAHLLTLGRWSPASGRIEEPARWQPDYVRPPGARPAPVR